MRRPTVGLRHEILKGSQWRIHKIILIPYFPEREKIFSQQELREELDISSVEAWRLQADRLQYVM